MHVRFHLLVGIEFFEDWLNRNYEHHFPTQVKTNTSRYSLERPFAISRSQTATLQLKLMAVNSQLRFPAVVFDLQRLTPDRTLVNVQCYLPELRESTIRLLNLIVEDYPEALKEIRSSVNIETHKKPGRPGLDHDEIVSRLAKAQEATEMKSEETLLYWKEIAIEIQWKFGSGSQGLALLRDARRRLTRLEISDPEGLLKKVQQLRAKETKKM